MTRLGSENASPVIAKSKTTALRTIRTLMSFQKTIERILEQCRAPDSTRIAGPAGGISCGNSIAHLLTGLQTKHVNSLDISGRSQIAPDHGTVLIASMSSFARETAFSKRNAANIECPRRVPHRR